MQIYYTFRILFCFHKKILTSLEIQKKTIYIKKIQMENFYLKIEVKKSWKQHLKQIF